MEYEIESHHFIVALLIVFVGIVLYNQNFLGVPSLVGNLTRTVTGALQPITGNINVGQIAGTS